MGLFGKKVKVTVHGYASKGSGADGRYSKQARRNRISERKKIRDLKLEPKTADELCAYIEETYSVKPLPETDEIVKEAKAKMSDWEPLSLSVYNIVVMQGSSPAAWLEVYVEKNHDYLAFRTVDLECDDEYSVKKVIADIVNYFGAGKNDKKAKNDRYNLLVSVQ